MARMKDYAERRAYEKWKRELDEQKINRAIAGIGNAGDKAMIGLIAGLVVMAIVMAGFGWLMTALGVV